MIARRLCVAWFGALAVVGAVNPVAAQDSTRIRLGINYAGSGLPPLVVVAGSGLDSVRKIVERDLQFSDRFEVPILADSVGRLTGSFDPAFFKSNAVAWALELQPSGADVEFKLYDLSSGQVRQQGVRQLDRGGIGDSRLAIHRLSDEIVTVVTGDVGIAASRIVFKLKNEQGDGIWRVDVDGANQVRISRPGGIMVSPAWSPDATRVVYTENRDGVGKIIIQSLATGTANVVPTTTTGNNWTATFSPDGNSLAFAKASEKGTDLYEVNIAQMCCGHRLSTQGNLADSYAPTYSPDGRRIAFVTNRSGSNRIYVMDQDGSGQEALVPFDVGTAAYDPDWSPSGGTIAFAADVEGGRQVMTYVIGTGRVKQHTSGGTNENPSWGPDSRHLVFKSKRTGQEQLFILDVVTSNVRHILTRGAATYPAWSRSIVPNP